MRLRKANFIVAVSATALVIGAIPGSALAASGPTELNLGGSGLKSLKNQKVKLTAGKPATLKGGKLTLPTTGGAVGESATVVQGGSLQFKRGKRKSKITSIRVSFGGKTSARVSGRLGSKQMTIFTIKAQPSAITINRIVGAAEITGRLTISKAAAKAIRKKLRLRRALKRGFGSVAVEALIGGNTPTDTRPGCWTTLARPATAVDITAATINWHVKESFANYLASGGPGSGATAIAPATPGATQYDFQMGAPFSGWYDPASGKATVSGSGGVSFKYVGHGLDISTVNPLVEIDGACSRASFVYGDGLRRGVVDLSGVAPSGPGPAYSYNTMPGKMSGEAAPLFGYPAGTEWGWMTVSVTTP